MDYACWKIDSIIEEIERRRQTNLLHKAFIKHLRKVSKALHDLEWVYSCDYSEGAEVDAIKACIDWKKESISVIREELDKLQSEINHLNSQIFKVPEHRCLTCAHWRGDVDHDGMCEISQQVTEKNDTCEQYKLV